MFFCCALPSRTLLLAGRRGRALLLATPARNNSSGCGGGGSTSRSVEIFEVGPRDGLQNEKRLIPAAEKAQLVDLLSLCGFSRIEVASFVSPKWVPQMADGAEVLAAINRSPAISYAALTPNMQGYENAVAAKVDEVAIFASASEGFSQANLNCDIATTFDRFGPIVAAAKMAGIKVRGYISCVTDCPFDGQVAPASVADVAAKLHAMGCYEISLGDTIGHARPETIGPMLDAVIAAGVPPAQLAGHYHDTKATALANIEVSLEKGLRVFDAAVGGLGGCPFAPGAAGNVATEAVALRLAELGYDTGLDSAKLADAAAYARKIVGRPDEGV